MGETVIKRIDNLDDMISSITKKQGEPGVIQQLNALREDLIDLLGRHSIEAFAFEKGTEVDVPTRRLVKVIECFGNAKKKRILATDRIGFRYQRDVNSPSMIIRKPEVRIG